MRYKVYCLLLPLLAACAPKLLPDGSSPPTIITDRRGERWDVSHAINKYGFHRTGFEFGLGRDAIPPINNPTMSSRGDADYPSASAGHEVIGLSLEGESRGYPIQPLNRHEVVNETIGNIQAAVAY